MNAFDVKGNHTSSVFWVSVNFQTFMFTCFFNEIFGELIFIGANVVETEWIFSGFSKVSHEGVRY